MSIVMSDQNVANEGDTVICKTAHGPVHAVINTIGHNAMMATVTLQEGIWAGNTIAAPADWLLVASS